MKYYTEQHQDSHSDMMRQHCGKKGALTFVSDNSGEKFFNVVKQRRKVHFSESPAHYQFDQKDKSTSSDNNIWYTKPELAVFTKQARDHVLGLNNPSKDKNTRGYERYDFERIQQKAMTRKVVLLLMQQKLLSDEEKSTIAHKASSWAVEEAFVQGCMDFCEAYHPKLSNVLQQRHHEASGNSSSEALGVSFLQQKKKRKLNKPYRDIGSRAA